jgi:Ca2+-binding RTX toxin-like protein
MGNDGNDTADGGTGYDCYYVEGFQSDYRYLRERGRLDFRRRLRLHRLFNFEAIGFKGSETVVSANDLTYEEPSQPKPDEPTKPKPDEPAIKPVVFKGTNAGNVLIGNELNNTVFGYGDNDKLYGGAGVDKLYGGLGIDVLVGGTHKDFFVFDTKPNRLTNRDVITDFRVIDDTIWLNNAAYTKVGANGALKAGAFYTNLTGKAHDRDDRVIYEKDTGKLFYDADGTGPLAGVHFATVAKNLSLTHKDFHII